LIFPTPLRHHASGRVRRLLFDHEPVRTPSSSSACGYAWNKGHVFGVIGIQSLRCAFGDLWLANCASAQSRDVLS
jgi:hypothetical protein